MVVVTDLQGHPMAVIDLQGQPMEDMEDMVEKRETKSEALAPAQPEEIDSEGKQWGSYGGGSSYGGGYRPSRPSYGSYRPSRPSYGSSYGGYGRKKRDTESEALAAAQPEEIDSEGKQWGSYGGGSSYGGSYRPSRPTGYVSIYRPSRPSYGGYGRKKRDTESEASLT